jgi:hypothetical protein
MSKEQLLSKFRYHSNLAIMAACYGNWADVALEDARATLALWHYWRV